MTIMYTIGIVLLSIAFTFSFFSTCLLMAERKFWMLPISIVIGTILILVAISTPRLDRYYGVENPHSYQDLFPEAYKEGYQDAIMDAQLIEVNDYCYAINFNGQIHYYSYEEGLK